MRASDSIRVLALGLLALRGFAPSPATAADPDDLVPGRIVAIKPGTFAKFVAKPPADAEFGLPGPSNDPTTEGGLLTIFDAGSDAGENAYVLSVQPAPLGWSGLGSPPGSKGYKYRGAGTPADPCTVVLVKPKLVKAVCKGAGVTLAPPFSGEVGIVLTLGDDWKRYCASFGGTELKNEASQTKRKQAPAPLACPASPPAIESGSIFVDDASGSDANDGSMLSPKATIQAGIAAAALGGGDVHVSVGTYAESITLSDGVSVFGGYDAADGWSWSPANVVTISGGTTAVLGTSIAATTELADLAIASADATTAGASSYGVHLTNSTGVVLTRVAVQSGAGAAGSAGASAGSAASGGNGGIGNPGCENSPFPCSSCSLPAGGSAGTSICGRSGGKGGTPGLGVSGGADGDDGTGGTSGGAGAPASSGNGQPGSPGAPGMPGVDGGGGASFGVALAGGYQAAGGDSGTAGDHGNGGGGGGGGGGGDDSCNSYGSSGGGGGGGGCGGSPGGGGGGGGGSFGLYLSDSTVSVSASAISSTDGGAGGDGGSGGAGGAGGDGGSGGPYGGSAEQDDGGNGAAGGDGGNGGDAGDGGGGGGGPSIAISCAGASSLGLDLANALTPGVAGSGGSGPGLPGSGGLSEERLGCP